MNKTALKNFATNARRELIKKVEAKALKIGITEENIKKAQIESSDAIYIDGKQLSITEKKQRDKLIQRIKDIGFNQVVEEVAYTWFNRFIALRFMEVNNYLPTKVRVLSSSNPDSPEPDILKEALSVDLDIDKELVYDLKLNNKTEELYKYLIIKQCNSLNKYLPFLFETIEDYKEILFPEGLLVKDSFLREMTDTEKIPESDWEQVEIIGWLYQYYIAEKKDQVYVDLKKNIKISKENIPAATQLFTPHWIVRYMVENSLGRIWLESYPDSALKSKWKYYLEEAEQEDEVKKRLEEIRYKNVNPENITFLDPCCGSGHILVYAFDVFYDMYLEKGYINHEIPKLILEKNLFGLDIDDRAVQLASFAVMMKAREKSRRVFGQEIKLNICAIQESNWMTNEIIEVLVDKRTSINEQVTQKENLELIRSNFIDAKEYGSLINVKLLDESFLNFLESRLNELISGSEEESDIFKLMSITEIIEKLPSIIKQQRIMSNKYTIVCTNPPYMGSNGAGKNLSAFLKRNYPNSKSDLFSCFIEKGFTYLTSNGFLSMITMESWMSLSSYEKLRENIIASKTIINMVHMPYLGKGGTSLGINFGTSAFIIRNSIVDEYAGQYCYIRYFETNEDGVPLHFPTINERFKTAKSKNFPKIPGTPIAYWVDEKIYNIYKRSKRFSDIAYSFQGMITGNNDYFLRLWHEVDFNNLIIGCENIDEINDNSWIPYKKGGDFCKWYGNNDFVLRWINNGKGLTRARTENRAYYLKEGVTWSYITSAEFSARYFEKGYLWDVSGSSLFIINKEYSLFELLAYLNSPVAKFILSATNPTINFQVENILGLPYIQSLQHKQRIEELVSENIEISKIEWNNSEKSWDFVAHPFLLIKNNYFKVEDAQLDQEKTLLEKNYYQWKAFSESQFLKMKSNEEELNRIFIEIYNLEDYLTPIVEDKNITISKADKLKDIKSFISYAVGCMFGRYSLDEEGLVYAGGKFNPERYKTFQVDKDNIIPVFSEAYFEDDIVTRFVEFVKVTFGEETLEENLEFIADTLGKKNGETARETIRRYFLNDFFKDHVQTYKKRPIYWLFTSGKQKAFNCLIYMHRYDKTTLSRIRTDYLHPLQIRLHAERKSLLEVIEGGGTAKEISNAKKELKQLDLKIEELKAYDELLHHMADMQIEIDLDDGVAVNYAKFNGLLAKLE